MGDDATSFNLERQLTLMLEENKGDWSSSSSKPSDEIKDSVTVEKQMPLAYSSDVDNDVMNVNDPSSSDLSKKEKEEFERSLAKNGSGSETTVLFPSPPVNCIPTQGSLSNVSDPIKSSKSFIHIKERQMEHLQSEKAYRSNINDNKSINLFPITSSSSSSSSSSSTYKTHENNDKIPSSTLPFHLNMMPSLPSSSSFSNTEATKKNEKINVMTKNMVQNTPTQKSSNQEQLHQILTNNTLPPSLPSPSFHMMPIPPLSSSSSSSSLSNTEIKQQQEKINAMLWNMMQNMPTPKPLNQQDTAAKDNPFNPLLMSSLSSPPSDLKHQHMMNALMLNMMKNMIAVNAVKMPAENTSIENSNKSLPQTKKTKNMSQQKTRTKRRTKRSLECGTCKGCALKIDCGKCKYCLDKKKFGGPSKLRKRCIYRICQGVPESSKKIQEQKSKTRMKRKKRKLNSQEQQGVDDVIAVAEPVNIQVRRTQEKSKKQDRKKTKKEKAREEEIKKKQIQQSKLRYAEKYPPIQVENDECPLCFYRQISSNGICVMCLTPLLINNN